MQKYLYKDRRDPDYVPPKYTDEEMEDMYQEHVDDLRKERSVEEREINSTEQIF